jgi:hypothetical protein
MDSKTEQERLRGRQVLGNFFFSRLRFEISRLSVDEIMIFSRLRFAYHSMTTILVLLRISIVLDAL